MTSDHPSAARLSAWLDAEIEGVEAASIRRHVEACLRCRDQVSGWIAAVRELDEPVMRDPRAGANCLDDETLAAYCEERLGQGRETAVEEHLGDCEHCVGRVRDALRIEAATGGRVAEVESPLPEAVVAGAEAGSAVGRFRDTIGEHVRALADLFRLPLPVAIGSVAAAALLVLVVGQVLRNDPGSGIRYRGVEVGAVVEVAVDGAECRAHPDRSEPVLATLPRGAEVAVLEVADPWVRVRIPDGRRVWVETSHLTEVND